ncbi:MAG: tetratricopeptide repeat protein [Fusobacterium sp.]|nr:tetratricopeptide repeat protein [Fusobacterium sp.]
MVDIQKTYKRALTALKLRKYEFAISQAKEILSQNPNISGAYAILAQAYYGLNNYVEAESCIKQALKGNPTNVDYLCWYCAILNAEEQYEKALSVSDEALTIEPTDTTVMYWRGLALHRLGKLERAEDVTKYLLNKEPNDDSNHQLLAKIYAEKQQINEASLEYEKALELNPNNAVTYNNYALMKIDNEGVYEDESIQLLKESLRLNPEDKIVQNNLKFALKKKKIRKITLKIICLIIIPTFLIGIVAIIALGIHCFKHYPEIFNLFISLCCAIGILYNYKNDKAKSNK